MATSSKKKESKGDGAQTLSAPAIHLEKYLNIHSDEYARVQKDLLLSVLNRRKMWTEKEWSEKIRKELTRELG